MMKNWLLGVLGLVVIGVSFMNLSPQVLTWTLVVVGVAISAISFWGATADGVDTKRRV